MRLDVGLILPNPNIQYLKSSYEYIRIKKYISIHHNLDFLGNCSITEFYHILDQILIIDSTIRLVEYIIGKSNLKYSKKKMA